MPAYLRDAVSVMTAPGTMRGHAVGPCAGPCDHDDCARSRRMADALCPCGQPIGYETPFRVEGRELVHVACQALEAVA